MKAVESVNELISLFTLIIIAFLLKELIVLHELFFLKVE
jgi:hypothetical protein